MPMSKRANALVNDRDAWGEADRETKREAVLRTAARMFNEKGFHATSLDEVAQSLNVTKPTLYYYVDSKDEILFECVRIGLEMLRAAIDESARPNATALQKLVAAMHRYAEIVTMDFGMCVIRVGEDPLPVESRLKLRRLKAQLDMEFRQLIVQCIEEGTLTPRDPKITSFALAGAISWIGRWYRPDGGLTGPQIATQIIQLLVEGMCSEQGKVSLAQTVA